MVLDGYVRVSKVGDREGDSFISPTVQREQIEGWAALRGVSIVMQEPDLDRSGKVLSRPSLDLIMERIETGETGGIAVARIDRLSRAGVADSLRLVQRVIEAGGSLAVIDLGIDPTTTFGEFAITVLLALARMQSRQIGESWLVARKHRVDAGGFVGGFVPIGYAKGEDKRLQPDLGVRESLIPDLFERRASGESWAKLADWLAGEVGREVSAATVRNMIRCRTYLGEVNGGQGLVNRSAHQPLVNRALFERANAVRGVTPARSGNSTGLLSGLLRCAGCRYAMKATANRSRHGKPFLEYRCKAQRRERTNACDSPTSVSARGIEELVLARVSERIGEYRMAEVEATAEIAALEGQLVEAETELDAALDTRLANALGGGESARYLSVVASRRAAVDQIVARMASIQSTAVELSDMDLVDAWPDLSLHDRRRLLRPVLDCVFVRRGSDLATRIHFCWRGESPEVPTPGRRWTPKPFDFPG